MNDVRPIEKLHPQIDREETFIRFGYYPEQLRGQSSQLIVWRCANPDCSDAVKESRERTLRNIPMYCRPCNNKFKGGSLEKHNQAMKAQGLSPNGKPIGENMENARQKKAAWRRQFRRTPLGRSMNTLRVALKRIHKGVTTKHLPYTIEEYAAHIQSRVEAVDYHCPLCRSDITALTCDVDHRIPLTLAASDRQMVILFDFANLDVLCPPCNQFFKNDRFLDYWSRPGVFVEYQTWQELFEVQTLDEMRNLIRKLEIVEDGDDLPVYNKPGKSNRKHHKATFNGEERSLRAWANDPRCPEQYPTVYHRVIKKGMTPAEALRVWKWLPGIEKPETLSRSIESAKPTTTAFALDKSVTLQRTFNYQERQVTIQELHELSGVRYTTIDRRLREGKSVEEAITAGRVKSKPYKEQAVGRAGMTRDKATEIRKAYQGGLRGQAAQEHFLISKSMYTEIISNRTWIDEEAWWRQTTSR